MQAVESFATNEDMRFAALALTASTLVATMSGCSLSPSDSPECTNDSQCGDDVCARTGECMGRTAVHSMTIQWTVNGSTAASASECVDHPNLFLQFDGSDYGDSIQFSPVVCTEGQFTIDKLPARYQKVQVGVEGLGGPIDESMFGTNSRVVFDLFQSATE
jgi:hypothetical protein